NRAFDHESWFVRLAAVIRSAHPEGPATGRVGSRPWSASASRSPSPESSPPDLRLHPVLERVSLRPRLPLVAPAEDDPDRGLHRARARRRLLLGSAHGRRPPGLDPRALWSTPSLSSITSPPSPAP